MAKSHIAADDIVEVISGAHKGETGKVLQIVAKGERAVVEGVNLCTKHMKRSQDNPEGAIIDKEAPIHVSNLRRQE